MVRQIADPHVLAEHMYKKKVLCSDSVAISEYHRRSSGSLSRGPSAADRTSWQTSLHLFRPPRRAVLGGRSNAAFTPLVPATKYVTTGTSISTSCMDRWSQSRGGSVSVHVYSRMCIEDTWTDRVCWWSNSSAGWILKRRSCHGLPCHVNTPCTSTPRWPPPPPSQTVP